MKLFSRVCVVLFGLMLTSTCTRAAKIAVLYPGATKSHLIAVMPIVEALAERGHDVTLVSAYQIPSSTNNNSIIRMIHMADFEKSMESMPIDWFAMSEKG